jgi:Na+-transporting methylmalonyl-CoA/oxaloacetate decarboxylase gamma subunit
MPESGQPNQPAEPGEPNSSKVPLWERYYRAKSEVRNTGSRLVGCVLVILAGACALLSLGIGLVFALSYAILAAGMVCVIETIWREMLPIPPRPAKTPNTPSSAAQESLEFEEILARARDRRMVNAIRAIADLLVSIGLALLAATYLNPVQPPHSPANMVSSAELEKRQADINEARAQLQQKNDSRNGEGKNGASPLAGLWAVLSPIDLVILGIVAIVVVGLVAKKHKEVVPVAGSATLAGEAIKHADKLSKMSPEMYERVLTAVLWCSGVLLVLFAATAILDLHRSRQADREKTTEDTPSQTGPPSWIARALPRLRKLFSDDSEPKVNVQENYLSSLGFSVLVLLWAAVVIGYNVPPTGNPIQPEAPKQTSISLQPLTPISNFVSGQSSPKDSEAVKNWVDDISQSGIRTGGILFLLGSTDCERYQGGNGELARKRAGQAKAWLGSLETKGVNIVAKATEQQRNCASSNDLRAVFPFLIQER